MDIVTLARKIAIEEHGEEYVVEHLDVVADIMSTTDSYLSRSDGSDMIAAAYLHDILEDTSYPESDLVANFGAKIYIWVSAVTDDNGLRNRKLKKLEAYHRIRKHNVAVCLKMADRLANIRRCHSNGRADKLSMYQKEHYTFAAALFDYRNREMWLEIERLLGADVITELYQK